MLKIPLFNKKKTNDRETRLEIDDIADINYQNSLVAEYIDRMMPFVTKPEHVQYLKKICADMKEMISL